VAMLGLNLLLALRPEEVFPTEYQVGLDGRVLVFTIGVTLLAILVFGLLPAWQAIRRSHFASLKETPCSGPGPIKARLQRALAVSQVAMALALLVAAGLFLRSLMRTLAVDPGFDTRHGLVAAVDVGFGSYDDIRGRQFFQQVLDRIRVLPGVESAALATDLPLGQLGISTYIKVPGYQPNPGENMTVRRNLVSEDYFKTLGVSIVQGRGIESQDIANGRRVMVVNETMARRFWPGADVLGRTVRANDKDWTVIGVARNGKYDRLNETPQPYLYQALAQEKFVKRLHLHARTAAGPEGWIPAVQQAIYDLAPDLPSPRIQTLTQFVQNSAGAVAGPVQLVGVFGLLALALAIVGVYGVMTHAVSRRIHEFGVRIAVGANSRNLLGLVLRQGLRLTVFGVLLGLLLVAALSRILAGLLYEIGPWDVPTYVAASVGLIAAGALASYFPARRAATIDPMTALRCE